MTDITFTYNGKTISVKDIPSLPDGSYGLFKKGSVPNFPTAIPKSKLALAIENTTLSKDQLEIMEFNINLNDLFIMKALNMEFSKEVPRMM
ncbi:MAG: hypothetical protein WCX73_04295 [Candidatus Pacearchaeota archaeon]|jgi:hypothetical protein